MENAAGQFLGGGAVKSIQPASVIRRGCSGNNQIAGTDATGVPRFGSTNSVGLLPAPPKLNMPLMLPAVASNEPPPRRVPLSQLSSMKRTTEAWLINVWST